MPVRPELLAQLRAFGELVDPMASVPSENRSGADRLRSPYFSQLRNLTPATAGASRDLEVGYDQLPPAYKRGLQSQTRPYAMDVGTMPSGYTLKGRTDYEYNSIIGDEAKTMAHELVHLLVKGMGSPFGPSSEENLARYVTKTDDPGKPLSDAAKRSAYYDNEVVENTYPDPDSGILAFLRRLLRMEPSK